MNSQQDTIRWYLSKFSSFEKTLNGESRSPVHALRTAAMHRLEELGFPTKKNEEWRFTDIGAILGERFLPATGSSMHSLSDAEFNRLLMPIEKSIQLVFLNGHLVPRFSSGRSGDGLIVGSLAEALGGDADVLKYLTRCASYETDAFTALNTGFMQDGAYVHIPEGAKLSGPVSILFVSTDASEPITTQPRNLIVAGNSAEVSLIIRYVHRSERSYFTNIVTELFAGERSKIDVTIVQEESPKSFHIGSLSMRQQKGSRVTVNAITFGGSVVRNNVTSVLDGEECFCSLNGLSLGTGDQHIDNHTTIDHAKPSCESHELYKTILSDRSRGVFNGKIYVRRDAQKTDAKQTNKTLLLSDDATMNTKPQLEIFADDVKCTHGAAIGSLDPESLFYLRSRGIGESEAKDLLTFAFASDVTERIPSDAVRGYLAGLLHKRLDTVQRGEEV
ncbi:MAG TPA: Fe-S cluster assembly protein SufD [Bacteroidota bacterium]|nr:Fe-S cluster assembly protein SufD [Bacteroidota bacterium]